jgi:hypothetical protein
MNNLSVGLVGCIGSQCCSGNTVWDAVNGVCTPAVSGFTTLAGASAADGVEKGGSKAAPYSAFEFGEYARL